MKKYIVSLLVLISLPLFVTINSVSAAETLDFSKVSLDKPLEKNETQGFHKSHENIEIPEKNIHTVLKQKKVLNQKFEFGKNASTSSKTSVQVTNNSPNTAAVIEIGNVYTDYITEEGQQKWYRFENSNSGKLTAILQTVQSSTIDYDLHLFKLNEETMSLEEEVISSYDAGKNEQLSEISDGGIYYLAVNSVVGSDPESPFVFFSSAFNII